MATMTIDQAREQARAALPPVKEPSTMTKFGRWLRAHMIQFFAGLALLYMFVPVFVVVLFSFNAPAGKFNYVWTQFSTAAWVNVWHDQEITNSLTISIEIALLATFVSTVLGTLIAFAIGRHKFRGRSATNLLIFMPMATPEVVLGSSLLTLFVAASMEGNLGFGTISIAHIMFCISFVVVTVKARLSVLDPRLEQAAMDPYADERQAFRYITLPLVAPGMAEAAALSSFELLRRLHHHLLQRGRAIHDVPDLRAGRRGPWCAATGERHRLHLVLRNTADRLTRSGHWQRAS